MKKNISRILIILNIILITCLLILSGILIYFSNTNSKSLFSYKAIIENSASSEQNLLIYNTDKPITGDIILLRKSNQKISLKTITHVENEIPYYIDLNGKSKPIDLSSSKYLGIVIMQSAFLGHAISIISNNTFIINIVILCLFLLCFLVLLLIYFLSNRSNKSFKKDSCNSIPAEKLPLKENIIDEPNNISLHSSSNIQPNKKASEPSVLPKLEFDDKKIQTISSSIPTYSHTKVSIQDHIEKTPSIEELLCDIQKQLGDND